MAGEQDSMKACLMATKREAEAPAAATGSFVESAKKKKVEVAVACQDDSLQSGADAIVDVAGVNGQEAAPVRKKMIRLPAAEVEWVLAQERYDFQDPDCNALQAEFEEYQDWVQSQMDKYGYVEVDEDDVAANLKLQEEMFEESDKWEKYFADISLSSDVVDDLNTFNDQEQKIV